jgi:hypothetical protein
MPPTHFTVSPEREKRGWFSRHACMHSLRSLLSWVGEFIFPFYHTVQYSIVLSIYLSIYPLIASDTHPSLKYRTIEPLNSHGTIHEGGWVDTYIHTYITLHCIASRNTSPHRTSPHRTSPHLTATHHTNCTYLILILYVLTSPKPLLSPRSLALLINQSIMHPACTANRNSQFAVRQVTYLLTYFTSSHFTSPHFTLPYPTLPYRTYVYVYISSCINNQRQ